MNTDLPFSWTSPHFGHPDWCVHHATTDDLGGPNDRESGEDW